VFAQAFDANKLALTGEPARVADDVPYSAADGRDGFAVSQTGVLLFRTGFGRPDNLQLTWRDQSGKVTGTVGLPGTYLGIDLSPDGKRVAVHRHEAAGLGDIWIADIDRGVMSRLTFDANQDNSSPVWAPDGVRVAFASQRKGKWGIYIKPADGTGSEERLVEGDQPQVPMAWSRDGRFLVSWVSTPPSGHLWLLPLAGDRKPSPLLQTPFSESHPRISPDGRWLAYESTESGINEVYVRPFPSGAGKWQISTNGGVRPAWSSDSKELYFVRIDTGTLMAADIRVSGSSLQPGVLRPLFDPGSLIITHNSPYHPYSVAVDGRFLMPQSATAASDTSTPITVVLNWTAALK
jgi:Tol biopolymer transport system component